MIGNQLCEHHLHSATVAAALLQFQAEDAERPEEEPQIGLGKRDISLLHPAPPQMLKQHLSCRTLLLIRPSFSERNVVRPTAETLHDVAECCRHCLRRLVIP
nr:hypothetical protein GCM10025732_56870 [Glycomyces mayteni]